MHRHGGCPPHSPPKKQKKTTPTTMSEMKENICLTWWQIKREGNLRFHLIRNHNVDIRSSTCKHNCIRIYWEAHMVAGPRQPRCGYTDSTSKTASLSKDTRGSPYGGWPTPTAMWIYGARRAHFALGYTGNPRWWLAHTNRHVDIRGSTSNVCSRI